MLLMIDIPRAAGPLSLLEMGKLLGLTLEYTLSKPTLAEGYDCW